MKSLFLSLISVLFGITFFPPKNVFFGLDNVKFEITEEDIYEDLMEN